MKSIVRVGHRVLIVLFALVFTATIVGAAGPEMLKIPAKGHKKIRVGVVEPFAAIELAALYDTMHTEAAKARGWELQAFDLKNNFPEAATYMENMISAGYDAIIIHWLNPKFCDKQIKLAFDKGIPVVTISCMGAQYPGVVAEVGPMDAGMAAVTAEFIGRKLGPNDKVVTMHISAQEFHTIRQLTAKGVLQAYNRKVANELFYPLAGDPFQWAYDQAKNVLLADSKKEIKGIWTAWEGFGVNAARAAHELGRDDVIVATLDDSPNTYAEIANLPTMWAASGLSCLGKDINFQTFALFDKIFKGEQVPSQKMILFPPRLVTKENLPPKGYFLNPCGVNPCGYKGRPDYVVR